MKKQITYLLLSATIFAQSAMTVSATSLEKTNKYDISSEITRATVGVNGEVRVKGGDVIVHYMDIDTGETLKEDTRLSGEVGEDYKTIPLQDDVLPGYALMTYTGAIAGKFTDEEQEVTYLYMDMSDIDLRGGAIYVNYLDTDGEVISPNKIYQGLIGDTYSTEADKKDIDGYIFVRVDGDVSGVFSKDEQQINYIYRKLAVQGQPVTVSYQDESGKSVSDDVILKGNIGEPYNSPKKDIKNYTFKEIQGTASGEFTDKAQTVTYVYKENSTTTTPSKQEVVNVYRLYNKKSMEHLYTADAYEYKHLPELSSDWVREGVNFKEYKKSDSTTVNVYRVYNPKSGEHLNTTDSNEVKVLTSKGWQSEGVAFYAPKADGKPVYRLFNPKAGIGAHFMTADSYEKSVLTKAPKEWKYEGVAWNSVK